MKKSITKIHLLNFKGYRDRKIENIKPGINIFIGDNETGKSTLLQAIDLVLSSNANRVASIGLDRLFNKTAVREFLESDERSFDSLPKMQVDLYFEDFGQYDFEGEGNLERVMSHGIRLECVPNPDFKTIIQEVITLEKPSFPFEYYSIEIRSFQNGPVSPYNKPVKHTLIDNTRISNEYASKAYIQSVFSNHASQEETNELRYAYRKLKDEFSNESFTGLNDRIDEEFEFGVRSTNRGSLETDLTVKYDGVSIDDLGVGAQCFIRTKFALSKKSDLDLILLEEPENHLSHGKMAELISEISQASEAQLFISTHSSLICSGLGLKSAIILGGFEKPPLSLSGLSDDTADFFMKAPNGFLLEFILSEKCILVEGSAEYIMTPTLFKNVTGTELSHSNIHVISVGGLSFNRYLEVARVVGNQVCVITDNDGKLDAVRDKYKAYDKSENVEVFYENNEGLNTFEKCIYRSNQEHCDDLFSSGRRSLSVEEYMLGNKSEVAFQLVSNTPDKLTSPDYIKQALTWISA